jgi:membrane protease YdiL (CAAX protease family)
VVFLFVGVTIVSRTVMLIRGSGHPAEAVTFRIPNSGVTWQAISELLLLTIVLWIGRIRGWSLRSFGLRPTWGWTVVGIVLFFAAGLTARFIGMLIKGFLPPLLETHVVSELTLPFIILISVVNPVFEESLWGGYFTHSLQRYGMWVTVFASALLRTFCHAHLGVRALVSILPMGVIYGLVYWRWRQLWPLAVAHSLQMLLSLLGRLYITSEAGSQARYERSWCLIGIAGLLFCTYMSWNNRTNKSYETGVI